MTANRYAPDVDQQVENDEAARRAVALVAAMYLAETADRRLTIQQRQMQDRAARMARGLSRWEQKRKAGHP